MEIDLTVETVIERPVEAVAAYAGDPSHAPEWYANIRSVQWRTPPPVAVGSRLDFVARFLGRRLTYTYEVTELDPGRLLVMRTAEGPFPDGDQVRLDAARRRRDGHAAAQPWDARRVRAGRGIDHRGRGAAEHDERPRAAQAPSRVAVTTR